jgi:hypothetical protein
MPLEPYRLYVAEEALEFFRRSSRKRQERFLNIFDSLAKDPFQASDFPESDAVGRPIACRIFGNIAIYWWADHPVKEVKILSIEPADSWAEQRLRRNERARASRLRPAPPIPRAA